MSDTMTSVEIEDVLSSIRKLVTEDLKPHPRVETAEAAKLVLTPSQRVEDTEPPPPLVLHRPERIQTEPHRPEAPQAEPQPVSSPRPEQVARLDGVVASIGAAVAEMPGAWESETGDAAVTGLSFASTRSRVPGPAAIDPWREEAAAGPASEHPAEASAQADTGPADTGPADTGPADAATAFVHRAAMDRAEASALAEIEAAAGLPAPDWSVPEAGLLSDGFDFADDDEDDAPAPELDEAALRDLVRDVLRDELQGPLGERITRNIRKLVRAEVLRALAVRDFE